MCFWNNVEKGDLFIKTPLIFENAKIFSSILLLYEKETKENADTKYHKFDTLRVVCYKPLEVVMFVDTGK